MKQFYIILFLLITSSLYAQKSGDVIKTANGELGVVFYVDQESILLVSPYPKMVQFSTDPEIPCIKEGKCRREWRDNEFDGEECTNLMREMSERDASIEFPILDSLPLGWYIPSVAEIDELFNQTFNFNTKINEVIQSLNGEPLSEHVTCWTSSQRGSNQVLGAAYNSAGTAWLTDEKPLRSIYRMPLKIIGEGEKPIVNYVWNTGSTGTSINVSPKTTTTYSVTATNTQTVCESTASKRLLVGGENQEIYETICEGECYSNYGFNVNKSGTYTQTVKEADCTTGITLHLTVAPKYEKHFAGSACQGEYYGENGFSVTPFVEGIYRDTMAFLSKMGCDSIVTLELKVAPTTYDTITRRICQNEGYKDVDFDIAANQPTGTKYYTVEKRGGNGCKSFHTMILQVDSVYQVSLMENYEEGVVYNQNGFNIDNVVPNASYQLETHAENGCDSIVTVYFRQIIHNGSEIKDGIEIPTAFTPHFEDDMNDHFMPGYEVYIYDRYGNLVCHSEDGWDGTYRGKVATAGVYVYTLILKDGEMRKGTIEVVKSK